MIVLKDSQAIAYVDLEIHRKENLDWIGLAVKPELRRQWFGKKILQEYLSSPFALEFNEIWAGIDYDNIASRKCFESVGFKEKRSKPDDEGIIDFVF